MHFISSGGWMTVRAKDLGETTLGGAVLSLGVAQYTNFR